jgi:hypothetical protein
MACRASRLAPMKGAASSIASCVKPLITLQGVLTFLGLVTGIAAILLPFGFVYPKGDDLGALLSLADLVGGGISSVKDALRQAPFFLLLLPIPIFVVYLQWHLTGRLAAWVWRTGYTLAAVAGAVLLVWIGWFTLEIFSGEGTLEVQDVVEYGVFVLSGIIPLSLGAWWVMRNRRAGVPDAPNALFALQVVYVADALTLLVAFIPYGNTWMAGTGWEIGALFVLLTVVTYVVQILLCSRWKGGIEHSVRLSTSLCSLPL